MMLDHLLAYCAFGDNMADTQQGPKPCPICGIAMVRESRDDGASLYRCFSCQTEIKTEPPTRRPGASSKRKRD
jgi:hypothetical protein